MEKIQKHADHIYAFGFQWYYQNLHLYNTSKSPLQVLLYISLHIAQVAKDGQFFLMQVLEKALIFVAVFSHIA